MKEGEVMGLTKDIENGTTTNQSAANRASASYMLKERARHMRRAALEQIKLAEKYEELAELSILNNGLYEETLWQLICSVR